MTKFDSGYKFDRRKCLFVLASPLLAYTAYGQEQGFRSSFDGELKKTRSTSGEIEGWHTYGSDSGNIALTDAGANGRGLLFEAGDGYDFVSVERRIRNNAADKWELSFRAKNLRDKGVWYVGIAGGIWFPGYSGDILELFWCGEYHGERGKYFRYTRNNEILTENSREINTPVRVDDNFHLFSISSDGHRTAYLIDSKEVGVSEVPIHESRHVYRAKAYASDGASFILDDVAFREL